MNGVCDQNAHAPSRQCLGDLGEALLVLPGENALVVSQEAVLGVKNGVWRIEVDEVAREGRNARLFKVRAKQGRPLQRSAGRAQARRSYEIGPICKAPTRDVEMAVSVYTIETVPTCPVQVDEPSRPRYV